MTGLLIGGAVKSPPWRADAIGMIGLSTGEVWVAIALVAAWFVWLCLKMLAVDLHYARSWNELRSRAQGLRQAQIEKLRALRSGQE